MLGSEAGLNFRESGCPRTSKAPLGVQLVDAVRGQLGSKARLNFRGSGRRPAASAPRTSAMRAWVCAKKFCSWPASARKGFGLGRAACSKCCMSGYIWMDRLHTAALRDARQCDCAPVSAPPTHAHDWSQSAERQTCKGVFEHMLWLPHAFRRSTCIQALHVWLPLRAGMTDYLASTGGNVSNLPETAAGPANKGSSQYRGVSWHERSQRWEVRACGGVKANVWWVCGRRGAQACRSAFTCVSARSTRCACLPACDGCGARSHRRSGNSSLLRKGLNDCPACTGLNSAARLWRAGAYDNPCIA